MHYYTLSPLATRGGLRIEIQWGEAASHDLTPVPLESLYRWISVLLRGFRSGAGMEQKTFAGQLAEVLRKHDLQSYVSKVERGSRQPSWRRFAAWAAVLHFLPHQLAAAAETLARARTEFDEAQVESAGKDLYGALVNFNRTCRVTTFSTEDRTWKEFAPSIGPAIHLLRVERGLKQGQLAAVMRQMGDSVGQGYISAIEGRKKQASWATLAAAAVALGRPLSDVFRAAEIHASTYDWSDNSLMSGIADLVTDHLTGDGDDLDPQTRDCLERLRAKVEAKGGGAASRKK